MTDIKQKATRGAARQKLTVALCGNPNSGKTTLFNTLTGGNQKTGNWPGVTVEKKQGVYKLDGNVVIVDTPGIYSLSPYTPEERVAQLFLLQKQADVIINVVDVTDLERSLYLTSQLAELDIPVAVALNMADEAAAKGIVTDVAALQRKFGCPFAEISAAKNTGIRELMDMCIGGKAHTMRKFTLGAQVEDAVSQLKKLPQLHNASRYALLQLAQNDIYGANMPQLTADCLDKIKDISAQLQSALCQNVAVAVAEMRYAQISEIATAVQKTAHDAQRLRASRLTDKIDAIVLNKWLAYPLFALIMAAIFYLSVDGLGGWLTGLINDKFTPALQSLVGSAMLSACPQWLCSLVTDGIIAGVMSVAGFVPQIMLLYGSIAILEASGYMSRIAFVTDKFLRKIGLGGRSFVALVLGCGCSVPAIASVKTIKNPYERRATATLAPFMPCSAKLALISFFTTYLLGGNALFAISFYFVSIVAVVAGGYVLNVIFRKKRAAYDTFVMELPQYRMPNARNVLKQMWQRGKSFLTKAGTVIFAASVILWLTTHLNCRLRFAEVNDSILAQIGKFISPIFTPLGWNDKGCGWQFSVATLTGFAAKETVVTTLQILLPQGLDGAISPQGAYGFVVYNLLTVPCVAATSASFAEQGKRAALTAAAFQTVTAYVAAFVVYQAGNAVATYGKTLIAPIVATAIAVTVAVCIYKTVKSRRKCKCDCADCTICTQCGKPH